MVNQVRISDYLKYASHILEAAQKELSEIETEYANAKVRYKAKFLPKLFGWKFEKSWAGDTSWLHGIWDTPWIQSKVKNRKALVDKLEYHAKIGNTFIEIDSDYSHTFINTARLWKYLEKFSAVTQTATVGDLCLVGFDFQHLAGGLVGQVQLPEHQHPHALLLCSRNPPVHQVSNVGLGPLRDED